MGSREIEVVALTVLLQLCCWSSGYMRGRNSNRSSSMGAARAPEKPMVDPEHSDFRVHARLRSREWW